MPAPSPQVSHPNLVQVVTWWSDVYVEELLPKAAYNFSRFTNPLATVRGLLLRGP